MSIICRSERQAHSGRTWSENLFGKQSGGRIFPTCGRTGQDASQKPRGAVSRSFPSIVIKPPTVPLVANMLAKAIENPAEIVRSLIAQVTGTVRWRESVVYMAGAGVTNFYEVGAGKVLSGLIRRLAEGAVVTAVGSPEDVAAVTAGRK